MTAIAHVLVLARLLVGITFVLSFVAKLRDVQSFRNAVEDFQVVPRRLVAPTAVAVLAVEATVAASMLTTGWALATGFVLAVGMLAAFSLAIGLVLRRRLEVSCNCFGSPTTKVSAVDLVRNGTFALFAVVGLWAMTAAGGTGVPAQDIALTAPIAAVVVALLVNLNDVVQTLIRPFPVEIR